MVDSNQHSNPLPKTNGSKKKILFVLLSILGIIVAVMASYFVANQTFITGKKAFTVAVTTHDTCNKLTVTLAETPQCRQLACPNGVPESTVQTSNYSVLYTISSNDNQAHTIKYGKNTNFCEAACGQFSNPIHPDCNDNAEVTDNIDGTVSPGTPLLVTLSRASPSGLVCGSFQTDLWIHSIDGNTSCHYTFPNEGAGSVCQTGITCPTPTTPATPSATLTPTIPVGTCGGPCSEETACPTNHACSNGKCVLNACLDSDTQCNEDKCTVVTPTMTPTNTPTNTPTLTPTITPSNNPTATPTEVIIAKNTPTTEPTSAPTIPSAGIGQYLPLVSAFAIAILFLGILL